MNKRVLLILIAVAMVLFGCGKKKAEVQVNQEPDEAFILMPLPNFAQFFSALDYLDAVDYEKAIPEKFEKIENDVPKSAFELGKLTADAILATKSRKKTKLLEISGYMIDYSKFISINDDILKLADELQDLIKEDKWVELEKALDEYKVKIEVALYETEEYDLFTLLQLGGWTEGLNRISMLLMEKYNADKSSIVDQKGILNSLIANLKQISNPDINSESYHKVASANYAKIKEVIYSREDSKYTEEDLKQLFDLTNEIVKEFR